MNKADIASRLGISTNSLYTWIKIFSEYFSEGATSARKQLSKLDLDTLATIAKLSREGKKHDDIRAYLGTGKRENFEDADFGMDTELIPAAAVEQMINATEIRLRLEAVQKERDELMKLLGELQERIESKSKENSELRYKLGRAEAQAELLREMLNGKND